MGLKDRVMELLRRGDSDGLERLAMAEPRAVRHLVGRLWDVDPERRGLAARAVGAAAAGHPHLGTELIRRLIWALNDESGMNGRDGIAALAAIASRAPHVLAPFVGPMVSYLWDDELRPELLEALAVLADSAPEMIAPHVDEIQRWLEPGGSAASHWRVRLQRAIALKGGI